MRIQIDPHTLERSEERGATEEEIEDVIETGLSIPAKHGRIGKVKVYAFKKERHGLRILWKVGGIKCMSYITIERIFFISGWTTEARR